MDNFISTINLPFPFLLLTTLCFFLTVYMQGFYLFARIFQRNAEYSADHIVSIVMGMNFFALIVLIIGFFGVLNCYVITGILIIGSIAFFCVMPKSFYIYVFDSAKNNILTVIVLILVCSFFLGSSLVLPFAWDEQIYHLAVPYRWMHIGDLRVFMDNPYSAYPMLPEILFRFGCETGGVLFPGLLCLILFFPAFLGLFLILKKMTNSNFALSGVVLFVFSPLVFDTAKDCYVEVFLLLDFFAGILIMTARKGIVSTQRISFALGILSGAALSVKLTGGSIGVILYILSFIMLKDYSWKRIWDMTLFFVIGTFVLAFPFFFRTFFYTGNPFFPYLAWLFTNDDSIIQHSHFYHLLGSSFGIHGLKGFFPVILYSTYREDLFDAIITGYQYIPLLIMSFIFAVKGIMEKPFKKQSLWPCISLIIFYFLWFFTAQQTRFLLPACAFMIIGGICMLFSMPMLYARLCLFALFAIAIGNFILPWQHSRKFFHYYYAWKAVIQHKHLSSAFLKQALGKEKVYIEMLDYIARNTPKNSKLMLLFDERGLYVPRKFVIGSPLFQTRFFSTMPVDGKAFARVLAKEKIDYILMVNVALGVDYNKKQAMINLDFSRKLVDAVKKGYFVQIHREGPYTLLKFADIDVNKRRKCQ